ncbi:MAG: hypothetical protein BroJett040_23460 [Oligoflexia bacterium]|nr:MAG: hypothetical protein BroJett040_23460 [Oligoflexia bacterium]
MISIDWNQFRVRNKDATGAFEDLCYHLFCRKYRLSDGVKVDFNQAGLETEPVKISRKYVGFQSKFFDNKIDYQQIKDSIETAIRTYKGRLHRIHIYVNRPLGQASKARAQIEKTAKKAGIDIDWVVPSHFKTLLSKASNLDLAQFYFGVSDVLKFIENSTNKETLTLLASKEYIALEVHQGSNQVADLKATVLGATERVHLLVGSPGSGKSVHIHRLFSDLACTRESTANKMLSALVSQGAFPMLVNLRNCVGQTLESLIAARKSESVLNGQSLNFVYLFDGLDELSEETAEYTLCYIQELSRANTTQKIVMTCRLGNHNRTKAKLHFPNIVEYRIGDLQEAQVDQYFVSKGDKAKENKLNNLKIANPLLLEEIRDVLFVRLLWDTILDLRDNGSVLELLERKSSLLLNLPHHKRNLVNLNLPDPKGFELNLINREIAAFFQKKYQFRFPLKDLQSLLLNKYRRLNYSDVNEIISYLATVFFDNHGSSTPSEPSYVYQHRRYQEFFFVQHLKQEYEKNCSALRQWDVLANQDLLEKLFLPYLRSSYESNHDIVGVTELNLIDVYLGKHSGFGVDDAYYQNSNQFPQALSALPNRVFMELMSDEQLNLGAKIAIDLAALESDLKKWNSEKKDYQLEQRLLSIRGKGLSDAITLCRLFHESGKTNAAKTIRQNLADALSLFKAYKFDESFEEHQQPNDPFWSKIEDWVYLRLFQDKLDPKKILEELIRPNVKSLSDHRSLPYELSAKERIVSAFFEALLTKGSVAVVGIFDELEDSEFLILVGTLVRLNFIQHLFQSLDLASKIKKRISERRNSSAGSFGLEYAFLKKLFGIALTEDELKQVELQNEEIKNTRKIDWHFRSHAFTYGITCYTRGKYSFAEILNGTLNNFFIDHLLYAALFSSFIGLLKKEVTLEEILRDYFKYIRASHGKGDNQIRRDTSRLIGKIVAAGFQSDTSVQLCRNALFDEENGVIATVALLPIKAGNEVAFARIVSSTYLVPLENELLKWDGEFPSYIDRCFELSILFGEQNTEAAAKYFRKGILDDILRHGVRKDHIVSHLLVDALEVLWDHNYLDGEVLEQTVKALFNLTVRVANITDGKGTSHGPYHLLRLVAKHDVVLAETLCDLLFENDPYNTWNDAITILLLGKVSVGVSIEEIESYFERYRRRHGDGEVFGEKLKVYLEIAESSLYPNNVRDEAFTKAQSVVEAGMKVEFAFLRDDEEKRRMNALCVLRGLEPAFEVKEEEVEKKALFAENDFVDKIKSSKSREEIEKLFQMLNEYENRIVLKNKESWDAIVDHVFTQLGDLKPLTWYLSKNSFPHTDFMTTNSRYMHFGLGAALKSPSARSEIFNYLKDSTGHGGFSNLIKSFGVNDDREMCLKLFRRYFNFCELLVN